MFGSDQGCSSCFLEGEKLKVSKMIGLVSENAGPNEIRHLRFLLFRSKNPKTAPAIESFGISSLHVSRQWI